jgi:hypothetical protein
MQNRRPFFCRGSNRDGLQPCVDSDSIYEGVAAIIAKTAVTANAGTQEEVEGSRITVADRRSPKQPPAARRLRR